MIVWALDIASESGLRLSDVVDAAAHAFQLDGLPLMAEPILLMSPSSLRSSPPPALKSPALRLLRLLQLSMARPFCASSELPLLGRG